MKKILFNSEAVRNAMLFNVAYDLARERPGHTLVFFACPLCGQQIEAKKMTARCRGHYALYIEDHTGIASGVGGVMVNARTRQPITPLKRDITLTWFVTPHSGVATLKSMSFTPVVEADGGGYMVDFVLYDKVKRGYINYPLVPIFE